MFRCAFISSKKDETIIVSAIVEAERKTSGEIRVHIENRNVNDAYQRASELFVKLKMYATEKRNGTLIYVNPKHKKVAIVGDSGINAVVECHFWDSVVADIISSFREKQYTEGLKKGIERVGNILKEFFPYQNDDVDELPNTISR